MSRFSALRSSAKASPRTAIVAIIRATRVWLFSISPSAKPSAMTPAVNALHVMPAKRVPPMKAVTASLSSLGRDSDLRRAEEITHHLPPHRWVTLHQPLDDRCVRVVEHRTIMIRRHHKFLREKQHARNPRHHPRAKCRHVQPM
ncbi:MAG TPA: hypothetical protein VES40_20675 [Ilumatobacteraceae bacterium]|nr:hypothetical protein [Ilumatobacteraceae bacterium]